MMALGKSMFFIPRDFWYAFKDYDGSPIDVKEHQDAYEFFTRLQVRGACVHVICVRGSVLWGVCRCVRVSAGVCLRQVAVTCRADSAHSPPSSHESLT
jgi:hypothetical protein